MSDPFLLTANTLPIAFTWTSGAAVTHQLWSAVASTQAPVIRQILVRNPSGNPIVYFAVGASAGIGATSANQPIDPGTNQTFSVSEINNYGSILGAAAMSNPLTVTPGSGE